MLPVKNKLIISVPTADDDYFTVAERRRETYGRDHWSCGYCGDAVTIVNASLDHIIPQSSGWTHTAANLRTACLMCNSIKSGKTEEEAVFLLLKSFRERTAKRNKLSQN